MAAGCHGACTGCGSAMEPALCVADGAMAHGSGSSVCSQADAYILGAATATCLPQRAPAERCMQAGCS